MKAILKSLCTVVGIPTLIATIYFGFIASGVYVSEAKFSVRSAKGAFNSPGLTALIASPIPPAGGQDSLVLMEYGVSHDMLNQVVARTPFLDHYTDPDIDFLARLDREAGQNELLEYFVKHVEMQRDMLSDVITLQVRAFTPDMAKQLAELVIELNESLVNEVSTRMEEDELRSARQEVELAAEKLRMASVEISNFQSVNNSVSPQDESAALLERISGMESRLSNTRAELSEKLSFMRATAPDVVTLRNRANALERQLRLEKGRITGDSATDLSGLNETFQPLLMEQEIAREQYASTLSSLEAARAEAQRKKQYVVTFVEPNLPDVAIEPRRFVQVLTVAIFSFLAYLIGGLLWSALKDHIGY